METTSPLLYKSREHTQASSQACRRQHLYSSSLTAIGKLWARSSHWELHGLGSVELGKHFSPCIVPRLCRWIFVTLTKASDSQDEDCSEDIQPMGTFHCPLPPLERQRRACPKQQLYFASESCPQPHTALHCAGCPEHSSGTSQLTHWGRYLVLWL